MEVAVAPEHLQRGAQSSEWGCGEGKQQNSDSLRETENGRNLMRYGARLFVARTKKTATNNSVFLKSSHLQYYLVLPQTPESGVFLYYITDEEMEMLTRKQRLHPSGNSVWGFYYRPISCGYWFHHLLVTCEMWSVPGWDRLAWELNWPMRATHLPWHMPYECTTKVGTIAVIVITLIITNIP